MIIYFDDHRNRWSSISMVIELDDHLLRWSSKYIIIVIDIQNRFISIRYRYHIVPVSILYRYSIDTVSMLYRYCIDTVSLQYRYPQARPHSWAGSLLCCAQTTAPSYAVAVVSIDIVIVSIQYRCCIGTISIQYRYAQLRLHSWTQWFVHSTAFSKKKTVYSGGNMTF